MILSLFLWLSLNAIKDHHYFTIHVTPKQKLQVSFETNLKLWENIRITGFKSSGFPKVLI